MSAVNEPKPQDKSANRPAGAPPVPPPQKDPDPLKHDDLPDVVRKAFDSYKQFYQVPGRAGLHRRQAALAYPPLVTLFPARPSLRVFIDMGKPLEANIASQFRVPKGLIGRLRSMVWDFEGEDPEEILDLLGNVEASWMPKDQQNWSAMLDVMKTCGVLRAVTGLPIQQLVQGCGGKWVDYAARLRKAAAGGPRLTNLASENVIGKQSFVAALKRLAKDLGEGEAVGFRLKETDGTLRPVFDVFPKKDGAPLEEQIKKIVDDERGKAMLDAIARGEGRLTVVKIKRETPTEYNERVAGIDRQTLRNHAVDVGDMVRTYAHLVLTPAVALGTGDSEVFLGADHREHIVLAASRILYDAKAAGGLLEASREWHRMEEMLEAEAENDHSIGGNKEEGYHWNPLFEPFVASNGHMVTCLTTSQQLLEESNRLAHCVGGVYRNHEMRDAQGKSMYVRRCLEEGYSIVSIRSADGAQSFSTICLKPVPVGSKTLEFSEHRGYDNGTPPETCTAAWNEFKRAVGENLVRLQTDLIAKTIQNTAALRKQRNVDLVSADCGYDWHHRDNIENADKAWDQFKPPSWRGKTLDDMVGFEPVAKIVKSLNPHAEPEQGILAFDTPAP